jgi:hypothetical protein
VFRFSLQLFSETFLILLRIQQDRIINVHRSSCKIPLLLQILMKLESSRQIFAKYSNVKVHENPPIGSRVVPCGWTDGQILRNCQSLFRNFANVPKNAKTCCPIELHTLNNTPYRTEVGGKNRICLHLIFLFSVCQTLVCCTSLL